MERFLQKPLSLAAAVLVMTGCGLSTIVSDINQALDEAQKETAIESGTHDFGSARNSFELAMMGLMTGFDAMDGMPKPEELTAPVSVTDLNCSEGGTGTIKTTSDTTDAGQTVKYELTLNACDDAWFEDYGNGSSEARSSFADGTLMLEVFIPAGADTEQENVIPAGVTLDMTANLQRQESRNGSIENDITFSNYVLSMAINGTDADPELNLTISGTMSGGGNGDGGSVTFTNYTMVLSGVMPWTENAGRGEVSVNGSMDLQLDAGTHCGGSYTYTTIEPLTVNFGEGGGDCPIDGVLEVSNGLTSNSYDYFNTQVTIKTAFGEAVVECSDIIDQEYEDMCLIKSGGDCQDQSCN